MRNTFYDQDIEDRARDEWLSQKEIPLNRSPLFEDLLGLMRSSGLSTNQLAVKSKLSYMTVDKWLDGKTTHPRISSILAMADVLDHDVKLVARKATFKRKAH